MENKTLTQAAWHRRRGENAKNYAAFNTYVSAGPARSLAKLASETGRSLTTLERWSVKYQWVERATAYDTHAIEAGLSRRRQIIELARQQAIDLLPENLDALQAIARGQLPAGDQEPVLDRHGQPIYRTEIDPSTGEDQQIMVTRPAVAPNVQGRMLISMIELGGLSAKRGLSLEDQTDHLRRQLRAETSKLATPVSQVLLALIHVSHRAKLELVLRGGYRDLRNPDELDRLTAEAADIAASIDAGEQPRVLPELQRIEGELWALVAKVDPDGHRKYGPLEGTPRQIAGPAPVEPDADAAS